MTTGAKHATLSGAHKYFPHIDGLRSLAILPVVLYHLCPAWCQGGFAGVDVFFVISGYLITSGIISDLKEGRYSITAFYVRRIKRILPAYLAVIAFVLLATPFFYSVDDSKSISLTALYSLAYSANIYFYKLVSYFDLNARQNPLLHLWSLGIEEQFYLLIPLCMWLIWKLAKRSFSLNLLLLFAGSFVWSCLAIKSGHSQFAFFMLPSRAWELLAGAILSQLPPAKTSTSIDSKFSQACTFVGLALILASYVFLHEGIGFPGFAALLSVVGASLLIRYGERFNLLSTSSLVYVGKVSYSLYLWHWPVFTFLGSSNSLNRALAGLAATFIATHLSWRFVETPVRNFRGFSARHAFTLLTVCSLVLGAACVLIQTTKNANGEVARDWHGTKTWIQFEQKRDPRRSSCTVQDLAQNNTGLLLKIGAPTSSPTFALWGDSHALALMPGLDAVASERGQAGYYINLKQSLTLCSDIGGYSFNPRADREPVLQWLESRRDIVTVFLANRWTSQIRNSEDTSEIINICERLNKAGKRVFFVQSVPAASRVGVRLLSWGIRVPERLLTMDQITYNKAVTRTGENRLLDELARRGIATALPVNKAFLSEGSYHTGTESHSFYVDDNHLNKEGATQAIKFVASLIWPRPAKDESSAKAN